MALVAGALLVLALTRIGPHLVMMTVLCIIGVTGILSPAEALSGVSNSGVITVAAIFVVAAGTHVAGGGDLLVSRLLFGQSGEKEPGFDGYCHHCHFIICAATILVMPIVMEMTAKNRSES
ncbi:MAG: hypothetical protein R3E57_10375 [Porticoccaceae bacterium]